MIIPKKSIDVNACYLCSYCHLFIDNPTLISNGGGYCYCGYYNDEINYLKYKIDCCENFNERKETL
jgi:hypothetical protein